VQVLADAIVKLGRDPLMRYRLGNAARSVVKPFSEPRIAAQWHEVLYGQMPQAKKPVAAESAGSAAKSQAV
jgi:hypothetical protein